MLARRAAAARQPWVLVPVRGIARGKSRLAVALDAAARMRLNRRLLLHTLDVLEHWQNGLERCLVVSPCARTLWLARRLGALVLRQPSPCSGLNAALGAALRLLVREGARRVLILPCDLPMLSRSALDALLAHSGAYTRVVIAPDRAGTGTNAMLLDGPGRFPLHFGLHSFALHRDAARARGWSLAVCASPVLMFDLDTPEDLAAWRHASVQRSAGRPVV